MKTERLMELAGIDENKVINSRANRLTNEIMSASVSLIERTEDVLQNLDPVKDKVIRDMVIHNIIDKLKTKLV